MYIYLETIKSHCYTQKYVENLLVFNFQTNQFQNHVQWLRVQISGGPLYNQTWQTE